MDVMLSQVLQQSPQHAGFSQCLQPPPSPPGVQPWVPGAAPRLLTKPGGHKPWWTQPGAGKAWDEATLALANCVCMSFPSTCQGETCRKAAPT